MQVKQVLLVLLSATVAAAHFRPGSDFCADEKERYDSCKPLVSQEGCKCSRSSTSSSSSHSHGGSSEDGSNGGDDNEGSASWEISGSGSGSGNDSWEISGSGSWEHSGNGSWEISGSGSWEHSGHGSGLESGEWEEGEYCFLLQIFLNYSITLDIELQVIFIEWINKTQLEIVQNKNLTEYQILVEFWYSLQILFTEYYELEVAIRFLYIGEWGYVCDLEGLAINIQTASVEVTIQEVIEISGGTCLLIEALEGCKENVTSSDAAAIEVLITEITVIIKGYYSFSETLVLIYEKFTAFCVKYPHLVSVIYSGKIEGFGILQSYIDICAVYWRIDNFELAVGGSTSDCALIKALFELYSNTSYSTSQRSDFKELHDKMVAYYETEISIEIRVEYFAVQFYQLLIVAEWDLEAVYLVEIKGYGSIYQFIFAYTYCQNHGIGPGDFTVSAEPTTSTTTTSTTTTTTTTTTPSTTTPTTTKPTTTKPTTKPTTTKPNGNCGTVTSVNVYSASTNYTKLLQSIDEDQADTSRGWTTTQITQFSGYKKRIYNYSVNVTMTEDQKFNSIRQVFTGFAGATDLKTKIMEVFIITWGTVQQYCNCPTL